MSSGNALFRHSKREEWGLAIVVEELEDRTTYLFESAGQKTLQADYLYMVEPADLDPAEAASAYQRISMKRPVATSSGKVPPPVKKPDLTFDQQVEIFLELFPKGFADPKFLKDERGPDEGKGAHKQAAILRAKTELSAKAFKGAEPAAVFATVQGLMQASKKLVSPSDVTKVSAIAEDRYPIFASALQDLLHGTGAYAPRFDAWVRALTVNPRPNWPMATLLPALLAPDGHVFIKPTFFRLQAAILDLDGRSAPLPDGLAYTRSLEVAKKVGELLTKLGHKPRDLWDVCSFICKTANVKLATSSDKDDG